MSDLTLSIQREMPGDADAIERLHERAFGPGRYARAAERVREQAGSDPRLNFMARVATLLVGSVRMTPIHIGAAPAVMLGPLAVEPAFHSRGIGRALMDKAINAAEEAGYPAILLVGDESYYGRLGFKRVAPGSIVMPGPVDPMRLLLRTTADAGVYKGPVRGG